MIDTHCHLNLDPLYATWPVHVQSAVSAAVTRILTLGTDPDTNLKALEIAANSSSVSAAIGLHPDIVAKTLTTNPHSYEEKLTKFQIELAQHFRTHRRRITAIGECGLDYFRLTDNIDLIKKLQQQLFSFQLELADEYHLPVCVHIRDAHADTLKLLSLYRSRGVLHCFSGDQHSLDQALKLGFYISFAGNLTFKNALDLQALAKTIPLNRLLLETDSPYLNPIRGQFPNTPANIVKTYQFLADLKKIPRAKLDLQLYKNATQLFQF